jgi:hypothetical protein
VPRLQVEPADPSGPAALAAPLIHIGHHKTGTSWLQRFLFPVIQAGFCFATRDEDIERHKEPVYEYLIAPHPLDFNAERCRTYFQPLVRAAGEAHLVPVVSSERLSGGPHAGGYDTKEIADRLAAVFPGGKVLICIREQKSMILSTYRQYVRGGGTVPLRQYLQPPAVGTALMPSFDYDYFAYHRLIAHYHKLFGDSNVLVLPYEQLVRDPAGLVRRIAAFAHARPAPGALEALPYTTRENAGLTPIGSYLTRRLINPLFVQTRLNPRPWLAATDFGRMLIRRLEWLDAVLPSHLQRYIDARAKRFVAGMVGDRYRDSNRRLQDMTGLDLVNYGYTV